VDLVVGLFAPAGSATRSAPEAGDAHKLDQVRLLLAEDNEINQQIARELLEGAGATVEVANNGREAIDMLAAKPDGFHAVLMDLQMPELDGLEATRRIRADARFAKLPIIAMTAHALAEEREKCLAAGMVDHIAKPIVAERLVEVLSKWLKPRNSP